MSIRAKSAMALVAVIGLLGVGVVSIANAAPNKKKKAPGVPPTDSESKPTDVVVETEEGDKIVIDDKDAEAEHDASSVPGEILPSEESLNIPNKPAGNDGSPNFNPARPVVQVPDKPNPVDAKLIVEAGKSSVTPASAIKDVVKEVTGGQQVPPLATMETSPHMDPDGTVTLARGLLAREEIPGWKSDLKPEIAAWQKKVKLTSDGLFGPGSAARMAQEVGLLPLVRYWPRAVTTKTQAQSKYDSLINNVIASLKSELPDSQAQIDALTASMGREVAVTMGTGNPPTQKTRAWVQGVNDGIAEAAELKGEKELKS